MRHLSLAAAFVALASPILPVEARTLQCDAPRVAVCDGCLRKIIVTVRPGGSCQVSFEIAPGVAQGDAATGRRASIAPLTIIVEEPRRTGSRPPRRHRATARWSPPRPSAGRCFAFNGQRFCE